MLRIIIPVLADPPRYPAVSAASCLAVENGLRRVLGHVIADFGPVRAMPLKDFIQLAESLGNTGLLEVLAILAAVGCAAAVADS
ncbi:hypothetical protein D9M71_669290 [compost metagenome]